MHGRTLDEEMLDDLEEQLVMGDVSIETAGVLIQGLRDAAKRGEVPTDEEAIEVLQDLVASMLGSSDRPLKYAQDGITVWLFVGVNGVGKPQLGSPSEDADHWMLPTCRAKTPYSVAAHTNVPIDDSKVASRSWTRRPPRP